MLVQDIIPPIKNYHKRVFRLKTIDTFLHLTLRDFVSKTSAFILILCLFFSIIAGLFIYPPAQEVEAAWLSDYSDKKQITIMANL